MTIGIKEFIMEYDKVYLDYETMGLNGKWSVSYKTGSYTPKLINGYYQYEFNIAGTQRNTIKSYLTGDLLLVKYKNKSSNSEVSFKFPKEANLETVTVKYIDGLLIVLAKPIVNPTREIPLST